MSHSKKFYPLIDITYNILGVRRGPEWIKYINFQALPWKIAQTNWFDYKLDNLAHSNTYEIMRWNQIEEREDKFGKLIHAEYSDIPIKYIISAYGGLDAYKYHLLNYSLLQPYTEEWYCTQLIIRANKLDKCAWRVICDRLPFETLTKLETLKDS